MIRALLRDERGFIVSSELVLIATILVLGLIVGLSSIQHAVVAEMNDVGDAIGHLNQSYWYSGFSAVKGSGYGNYAGGGWGNWGGGAAKAYTRGSAFRDVMDDCDNDQCDLACDLPVNEGRGWYYGYGGNYCDNY